MLTLALLTIALLGYIAQSNGLCMVRGVNEFRAGNREFLLAILLSGSTLWLPIIVISSFGQDVLFKLYEPNIEMLWGGFLFGIGAGINGGCGVSTLGKLTKGQISMMATILGWIVGWNVLINLFSLVNNSMNHGLSTINAVILFTISVSLLFWTIFGNEGRRFLWLTMMGIGLLAGLLFAYNAQWTPSGLLNHINGVMILGTRIDWPQIEQYFLVLFLLIGMALAAWKQCKFNFQLPSLLIFIKHLGAGILMGIGASLAKGGNDIHLLLSLPLLSVAGFLSISGIILGIWFVLYIVSGSDFKQNSI